MSTEVSAERRSRPKSRAAAIVGVVVVAVVAAIVVGITRVAGGVSVPYTDPASTGRLTLCGSDGKAITSGDVEEPLAAVVVGSSSVPRQYAVTGAVASLFAHQPRPGVEPEEFSGIQLTGSSVLAHPDTQPAAVRITKDATTVGQFTNAFPATVHGFVQLRLIVSAPGAGALTSTYDTADLKVTRGHWRVIDSGSADCTSAPSLLARTS